MSRKRTQADKSWQDDDDQKAPAKRNRKDKEVQNKVL